MTFPLLIVSMVTGPESNSHASFMECLLYEYESNGRED